MKELSTNANTEIRWITQTSLSLHFIMSDIFTYIRTVVSAFTQRSTNNFINMPRFTLQRADICVSCFTTKLEDRHVFAHQHFPSHLSEHQHLAAVFPGYKVWQQKKKKKKAGLSHKHSAVVDWINAAHLTFPLSAWISTTHYSFPFAFSWSNICRIPLCAGYYCKSTHIRHKLYVLLIVRIVSASTHSYLRKETCCKML